jgi:hypothetical protein
MRVPKKKTRSEPLTSDGDSRSAHAFLREHFGSRFGELIARPITALQRTMRANGWGVHEASNYLIQRAQDQDPCNCTAIVIWLHAAREELTQGTPLAAPATSLC